MSVCHVYVNQKLFQALILELENELNTIALTTINFQLKKNELSKFNLAY